MYPLVQPDDKDGANSLSITQAEQLSRSHAEQRLAGGTSAHAARARYTVHNHTAHAYTAVNQH